MNARKPARTRRYLTVLVTLAVLGLLLWEHVHGGIAIHHVLNRPDLPAISNAWGAAVLPALAWLLIGRIQTRIAARPPTDATADRVPADVVAGFVGSLLFGIGLSVAFATDSSAISSTMFFGAFVFGMFLPIHRAECVLGFVLGMTFTFGGVLPVFIGSVIAAVAAFFNRYVHPALGWLAVKFKRSPAPVADRGVVSGE